MFDDFDIDINLNEIWLEVHRLYDLLAKIGLEWTDKNNNTHSVSFISFFSSVLGLSLKLCRSFLNLIGLIKTKLVLMFGMIKAASHPHSQGAWGCVRLMEVYYGCLSD